MEREVMITGIGGQGVQLAAQVLARAAAHEGRAVMMFGVYSGAMRGGNSDSTVVIADDRIDAPPIISQTWSALVLHHEFWEPLREKLRAGAVLVVNSSLFAEEVDRDRYRVFDVPATELAAERIGNAQAASMIMIGALAGLTGLVGLDAAVAGMRESVPSYRSQLLDANESAIRLGFGSVPRDAAPAWDGSEVAA